MDILDVSEHLEIFSRRISESIQHENIICYFIPVQTETRIECINPKIVSEEDYKQALEVLERNKVIMDEITAERNKETENAYNIQIMCSGGSNPDIIQQTPSKPSLFDKISIFFKSLF
jgi:hypothetical protein